MCRNWESNISGDVHWLQKQFKILLYDNVHEDPLSMGDLMYASGYLFWVVPLLSNGGIRSYQ